MAGLGFKDFQVGEVLTSSDVDGYLMQQAVMRFADSGARGSALGTAPGTAVALAEGMVSYLEDVNQVQVFDGSEWVAPVAGTGRNVVSTTKTDAFSFASAGIVDVTGLSVTITPSSSDSKMLVLYEVAVGASVAGDVSLQLARGTAIIGASTLDVNPYTASLPGAVSGGLTIGTFNYLDSPATTSAVTYQIKTTRRFSGTQYVNRNGSNDRFAVSSITAIEVAA